jgi:hypothetical protein
MTPVTASDPPSGRRDLGDLADRLISGLSLFPRSVLNLGYAGSRCLRSESGAVGGSLAE